MIADDVEAFVSCYQRFQIARGAAEPVSEYCTPSYLQVQGPLEFLLEIAFLDATAGEAKSSKS